MLKLPIKPNQDHKLVQVVGNLAFMEKTVTKSALSTVKTAHVTLKLEHVSVANLGGLESSVNKVCALLSYEFSVPYFLEFSFLSMFFFLSKYAFITLTTTLYST